MERLSKIRDKIDKKLQEYTYLSTLVSSEKLNLTEAKEELENTNKARSIIQVVAEEVQTTAHAQIGEIVTKCLQAIFDEEYSFLIKFEQKRGKTEANLLFTKDSYEIDPVDGDSGGVLDVASFALRLACLVLQTPRKRNVLILDEPFRHLSKNYSSKVAELLQSLSNELNVQFILVTHNPLLKMGKLIRL